MVSTVEHIGTQTRIGVSRSNTLNMIAYFHILLLCQAFVLEPIFQSLYYVQPGVLIRYVIALPMVFCTALHVPIFNRPSDLAVALAVITPVMPAFCYFTLHGGHIGYIIAVFLGFLTFSYTRRIPLAAQMKIEIRMIHLLIVCFSFLGIVVVAALQNFRINSLSEILLDLYGVRAEVVSGNQSTVFNYIKTWTYSVVIPFLLLYFYIKRNFLMLLLLFAILCMFFLMLTGKSIIINPFILLVIYTSLRIGQSFMRLFAFINGVILIAAIAYVLVDNTFLVGLFVRRTVYVPAMLNHHYHELFSEIGFVYYSHSVLSAFSDYPFQQSYQTLVGSHVFGTSLAHANTGIFGTGYMHFGYPGIIAFCAIMGVMLAVADTRRISRSSPRFAATIIALPTSTIFSSADLFSGMLTNGFLIALALLMTCGRITSPNK